MKLNKYIKHIAFAGFVCGALASCTTGFEDINNPGHKANAEQLGVDNYTSSSFINQLSDRAFPEQENQFQIRIDLIGNYLGRYFTYTKPGWSGKNFTTFSAPNGWVKWPMLEAPQVISSFNEIKRLASIGGSDYSQDLNYNWALILRAQAFLIFTDTHGPVPLGLDEHDPSAYNSVELIYKTLIQDLTNAANYLHNTHIGNKQIASDKVYAGDFDKWVRFANSLKLRIAIRMRFADPVLAKQAAEEAITAGVIEDNADNAMSKYTPRGLYKTSVEWGDSRACADIDSYMNGYSDPRISKYFSPAATQTTRPIVGCLAGANIGDGTTAQKLYSAALANASSPSPWLTSAEVYFCRAEGALAGWSMGDTAGNLYTKGVKASFEQWGAGDATAYLNSTSTPSAYNDATGGYGSSLAASSQITPKWNDSDSDETKLERIITQKWIALYPNGAEAWAELRRTGYPKVFDIQTSKNGYTIKVPCRIPYDSDERINNPHGYETGLQSLGGADLYSTKLWWQR